MAHIVVCEDDEVTRTLIRSVLSKAGHNVYAFDNAQLGFKRLQEGDVDLLISDVQMPVTSGFELLAQVRKQADLVNLPCILLTMLHERADMRTDMISGADDYVTKPFAPSELLQAVDNQLQRARARDAQQEDLVSRSVSDALSQRTNELIELYGKRLQDELQSRWARTDVSSTQLSGMLVVLGMMEQERWLELLSGAQMAELSRHFFNRVADSAALFGAEHLQFVGTGLLVVFDETKDTPSAPHRVQAQRFVQSLAPIRASMQAFVSPLQRPTDPVLPEFACSAVLHQGSLNLAKLDGVTGGLEQCVPVGPAMSLLARLLRAAQVMRWPLALSSTALEAMGDAVQRREQVDLKRNDSWPALVVYSAEWAQN
jgi:CheY-like chemotaxis protein